MESHARRAAGAHRSTAGLPSMTASAWRMKLIWPDSPPLGCGHAHSVIHTFWP